jgi:serine O-acetyltransferase
MSMDEARITESLVASYKSCGGINHVGGACLPAQAAVDALGADFMRLLFPGYFEGDCLEPAELESWTRARLADLSSTLRGLLERCHRFAKDSQPEAAAERTAGEWLSSLPSVHRLLQTDVEAAFEGDPAAHSFEEIILAYPCIPAITLQRVAHIGYRLGVPLLPRMLTEYAHRMTGIDIHPGASIGTHFFIDHGTGVVIGETSTLGKHVKIYQGVTLGAKSFPRDAQGNLIKGSKRHPDIEEGVTIYAGATILGGDTRVGAGSVIGSNVWLLESVPPRSFVTVEGGRPLIRTRGDRSGGDAFADIGAGI